MIAALGRTWVVEGPGTVGAYLAAVVAGWALVAWSYRREARTFGKRRCALLATLRGLTWLALVAMVAQPALQRRKLGTPRIAVLVDRSGSMLVDDVPTAGGAEKSRGLTRSRWQAATEWLDASGGSLLENLRGEFEVELLRGDLPSQSLTADELRQPPDDPAAESRLGDAVAAAASDGAAPPSAIVIATDGVVTAGRSLADATARAQALGVPLFAVAVGSERPRADVAVDDLVFEPIVFPGDRVEVEARVRATGYAGRAVEATLSVGGRTVATAPVTLPGDGESAPLRFAWRPTAPGVVELTVAVAAEGDEADADNNRTSATATVRREPIRLLIAASTPSFEYRALKSLLERDPAIELKTLLQDADAGFATVEATAIAEFPASRDELRKYDALILGDVDPALVPAAAWTNLLEFVSDDGAGVAVIVGPRFMPASYRDNQPVQTLLPLAEIAVNPLRASDGGEALRVTPTRLGLEQGALQIGNSREQTAAIWSRLPPVDWRLAPMTLKPGAETWAEFVLPTQSATADDATAATAGANAAPAIVRHFVGAGEVILHMTDETWRWRWRSDDRYFARYWGQTVRHLARGRLQRGRTLLTTDRTSYAAGETVVVRLRGPRPEGAAVTRMPAVEVIGSRGVTRRVSLTATSTQGDRAEARVEGLPVDRYEVRLAAEGLGDGGAATDVVPVRFEVIAPPGEQTRVVVDWEALSQAAEATGGRCYRLADADELLASLPPPPRTAVLEVLPPQPIWNHPAGIATVCALLAAEWLLRRRAGML